MTHRKRVASRPNVEVVEARRLLSAITAMVSHSQPGHGALVAQADGGSTEIPPNPLLFPTGQPTPRTAAKSRFIAKFTGPFTVGPGRFTSQSQQIYIRGAGGSNQFLHGDTQLRVVTPRDPSQPPGGVMSLFDRNINTNSSLGLELTANPATDLDAAGRPVHLTITQLETSASGGAYADAIVSGYVNIRYRPSNRHSPGVFSQGTATITVHARIYSTNTNFILKNSNIDP